MKQKSGYPIVLALIVSTLIAGVSFANADFRVTQLGGNLNFLGNDVDVNGTLWAGDKNFTLWKSLDNGATFIPVYKLPYELPTPLNQNPYSGLVWTVFVDSRGYIFVSGGGAKNCLYRSTNGGASFMPVLNANDTSNRSFYIAMTEDNQSNLYAATYTIAVGLAQPLLLKSVDGGTTWAKIGSFSVIHFHSVKYNPYNGYLYAVTGERSGSLYSCNDSEKIFRSKDNGVTWNLVVDRIDSLGTVYLAMAFNGSYVYLGQDYPNRICQIHRFYDNGVGPFVPQVVYTPSVTDGYMPFASGAFFNDTLIFGNCPENQTGTSRILTSADGSTWNTLYSANVTSTDVRWNFFTTHPRGSIFGTIKTGFSYQIKDTPPPTPTPTAEPTIAPTPPQLPDPTTPTYSLNPTQSSTTHSKTKPLSADPTPSPKPKPTPTPQPTQTNTTATSTPPSPTLTTIANNSGTEFYLPWIVFVAVMAIGTLLFAASVRKVHKK